MLTYYYLFTNYPLLVTLDSWKVIISVIFILEILITLAVLPFLLRLSGQLLVQTLKCRETIKNASDTEEHIPYYEHYRIMFCLLFVMLLFNVFNLIKAFYLIKPLFAFYVEPISLNLVLNFWFSFQDAIISFGLICMLQVMHFFKERKFNFNKIFLLAILRFFWVFLFESGLLISLMLFEIVQSAVGVLIGGISMFLFECIYLLRIILIFRFAKEGNDTVKRMINDILSNQDLRNAMGHERVENIYRATVLFKCLSWGNFVLAALVFIPSSIEVAFVIEEFIRPVFYYFLHTYSSPYFNLNEYFLSSIVIMELVYFLTSILYTMFFLILWKFLFNASKNVRFSGYSHFSEEFNMEEYTAKSVPLSNIQTFTGAKMQKILLSYYSIVSAFITIVLVGFITTLSLTGWNSVLLVHSGDFYEMKQTNLYKVMESCSKVTTEIYYPLYYNRNCVQTYFASLNNSTSTIPLLQNFTSDLHFYNNTSFPFTTLWVPSNTTITELKGLSSLNVSSLMQTDVPCLNHNEESSALQYGSVNFDCVIPEKNNGKLIDSCSTTEQCQLFNISIPVSSMISLTDILSSSHATVVIKRQIYNLSSLSVISVLSSQREFDWRKYDLIQNNGTKSYYNYEYCPIKFSCTLPLYYGVIMSILTLLLTPTYLMVSVLLIHRNNLTDFCYFMKKK